MLSHHGIRRFSVSFFLVVDGSSHRRSILTSGGLVGVDTFVDVFGIFPRMCCIVWVRCRLRQEIPGGGVKHFLSALAFLRVYTTQTCLRSMMGHPSRQVFRTWMWKVVKAIANAFEEVVSEFYYCCFPFFDVYSHFLFASSLLQVVFENRFRNDRRRTCKIIVDCTDCAIFEPWPWEPGFNRQFVSHKINWAALKYEAGVCIQTGDIVRVNGPFKAGKQKAWARHETVNGRLKISGFLPVFSGINSTCINFYFMLLLFSYRLVLRMGLLLSQ
jgi:hypothetical protein